MIDVTDPSATPRGDLGDALAAFGMVDPLAVARLGHGLIHDTYKVMHRGTAWVLQRVNPIFGPEVNEDIQAVTEHLARQGIMTPRLRPTEDGRPSARLPSGVWRLLTYVEGASFPTIRDAQQARSAATLLARFHAALQDFPHAFRSRRPGVHDTQAHLFRLASAVDAHGSHRLAAPVGLLADELHAAAARLPRVQDVPRRIVHGDPKLDNVLFAAATGPGAREARCLIDLDTVGPMELHLELGDCMRSWCNSAGEDAPDPVFDLDIYASIIGGYASVARAQVTAREVESLAVGVEWITLELAVRFAADALEERYFGWDRQRFSGRGEHNLARAKAQWALHREALACRSERESILHDAFRGA